MNWYVDLAIVVPALIIGAAVQGWLRHVIGKADMVPTAAGLPARSVAQRLLMSSGVHGVRIEEADEELDDH
jgi:Zn-dependent membrane protease YugP